MDKHNNVGRTVDMPVYKLNVGGKELATMVHKTYLIKDVSKDGRAYLMVDAFGQETVMPVKQVLEQGTNLA